MSRDTHRNKGRAADSVRDEGDWHGVPTLPWRERLDPGHIKQRLKDVGVIGPKRQRRAENLQLAKAQLGHFLKLSAESLKRPVDHEPLFFYSLARSGSTWISLLMGNHPRITWGGELWSNDETRGLPYALIPERVSAWHLKQNLAWQARREPCRYSLAKLMIEQVNYRHFGLDDIERYWPNARTIVMVRRNVGLRFVSWFQASTTQRFYQVEQNTAPAPRIHVNLGNFRRFCARTENRYRALAAHPIGKRALWLVYEAFDGNPQPALDACVWPFLGLPRARVNSLLRRQRMGSLADRVTNYDEVAEELEGAHLPVDASHNDKLVIGPPEGFVRPKR